MKKTMALSMNIGELTKKIGWPISTIGIMVELFRYKSNEQCSGCGEGCWKKNIHDSKKIQREKKIFRENCFSKVVTLQDVIVVLEEMYAEATGPFQRKYWQSNKTVLQRICDLGFTRLDSVALPQSTISLEDLKKLDRDKLLSLDARLLGTIKESAAARYLEVEGSHWRSPVYYEGSPATIKDVLDGRAQVIFRTKETEEKTRKALMQLGFTFEDGPFMRSSDRYRKLVTELMEDEGIDQGIASLIVQIAKKRGWVNF